MTVSLVINSCSQLFLTRASAEVFKGSCRGNLKQYLFCHRLFPVCSYTDYAFVYAALNRNKIIATAFTKKLAAATGHIFREIEFVSFDLSSFYAF